MKTNKLSIYQPPNYKMLSRFKQIEMYLLRQGHLRSALRCLAYRLHTLTQWQSDSGSGAKLGSEEEWDWYNTYSGVTALTEQNVCCVKLLSAAS